MVLFVGGKRVSFAKADLSKIVCLTTVAEEARSMHSIMGVRLECDLHSLRLSSSEMAEVSYDAEDGLKFIGTDNLTTCVLAVLDCAEEKTVIAAHLDGSATEVFLEEAERALFNKKNNRLKSNRNEKKEEVISEFTNVSVMLLGGFCDDSDYCESLVTTLIKLMSERYDSIYFNLDLCCVWILNNKIEREFNYPIHQGAVFDISRRLLLPAKYDYLARGPLSVLRSTRFNADPNIYPVYNSKSECLEIFPFDYKAQNRQKYYKSLSTSSDFMLRRFSTSPRQEQPGFESNMREVFTLMCEHPDPIETIFKSHHRPIRFKCDKVSGEWKKL